MKNIIYPMVFFTIFVLVSCGSDMPNLENHPDDDDVTGQKYEDVLNDLSKENKDPVSVVFEARKYFPASFKSTLEDETSFELNEVQKRVKQAQVVTRDAHFKIMKNIKEGITENMLKDVAITSFKEARATGEAFAGIVASGENSTKLNYVSGDRILQNGDLVVVNVGAKINGYCGDITRTYPVSGRFTDRQKEIYRLVLSTLNHVLKNIVPSQTSVNDIDLIAKNFLKESPLRAKDMNGKELSMDNFMLRSISHYVDTRVHNVILKNHPITPGKSIAIGPGIYIESENIGIRIEDTYLISTDRVIGYVFTPESIYDLEFLLKQN